MKPWWQSKVLWVNILVGVVAVLNALSSAVSLDGQPLLPSDVTKWLLVIVTMINFVLRGVTSQGIYYFHRVLFVPLMVLALCGDCFAAKAVIVGDEQVEPGDLALLDAATSEGTSQYRWVLVNSKKRFIVSESGSKVYFSSGLPGEYRFVLVAAGDNAGKLDIATAEHVVTVGVPPTPVPPGPGPVPPGPTPPNPVAGTYSVLVVYETSALRGIAGSADGAKKLSALYSTKAMELMSAKCAKDSSGRALWRRYDKDQPISDSDPFKPLVVAGSKLELPAIVIAEGAVIRYAGPLPAGEDAELELLTKWLGGK